MARGAQGGLSPRIRGNPGKTFAASLEIGSIPAHTGEPRAERSTRSPARVYPRAYGGTGRFGRLAAPTGGLSPRIRGNQTLLLARRRPEGSIPAHTGEPRATQSCCQSVRVYPRAYGGTPTPALERLARMGLSPRIRGNHRDGRRRRLRLGSIPAHTGEPASGRPRRRRPRVYPRAYGGTIRCVAGTTGSKGLSPRIRGNPRPWPPGRRT